MKHESGFNFEIISAGKHSNITQILRRLEALICAGRIAEGTASCYMLLYYLGESILFGPELLSSRFLSYVYTFVTVLGDARSNQNPALLAFGILFFRWHNVIASRYLAQNPTWTDEEIFQKARRFVVATLQVCCWGSPI